MNNQISILDAELYAILKALQWIPRIQNPRHTDMWIFTDSQQAIQCLQKVYASVQSVLYAKIHKEIQELHEDNFRVHIHWIPSHINIPGNDLADLAAKQGAQVQKKAESDTFTSIHSLKIKVKQQTLLEWKQAWNSSSSKGKHYQQFQTEPGNKKHKVLTKADKLTFATFMQLKLGHGYFKSYLARLPQHESRYCHGTCRGVQTPDHLLLRCKHFEAKQN